MSEGKPKEPEERHLIEITEWDFGLHLSISPGAQPQEHRFQGGLLYSRSLTIYGTVVSPENQSGKAIRLTVLPFGSDVQFGPSSLQELGQLREVVDQTSAFQLTSTLILPEDALPLTVNALATVWKFLHVWTEGDPSTRAAVKGFSFSRGQ